MVVAALVQPLVRQSSDIQTHNIIVNLNCIMFGTGLSKKHIKTAHFQGISNFLQRKQQGQQQSSSQLMELRRFVFVLVHLYC